MPIWYRRIIKPVEPAATPQPELKDGDRIVKGIDWRTVQAVVSTLIALGTVLVAVAMQSGKVVDSVSTILVRLDKVEARVQDVSEGVTKMGQYLKDIAGDTHTLTKSSINKPPPNVTVKVGKQ